MKYNFDSISLFEADNINKSICLCLTMPMRIVAKLDFRFVSGVRLKLTDKAATALIRGVEYLYFRVMPD